MTNLRDTSMFLPFWICEPIEEIVPYEEGKEVLRALLKSLAEAAKK